MQTCATSRCKQNASAPRMTYRFPMNLFKRKKLAWHIAPIYNYEKDNL
jgi:hypothetical protein